MFSTEIRTFSNVMSNESVNILIDFKLLSQIYIK